MKKKAAGIILMMICVVLCAGCGKKGAKNASDSDKIQIVCTVFPQYDWVKELIKGREERFEIELLQENGTDLHNYQPTAEDMVKISSGDVFIYVGGESDGWVDDALDGAANKDRKSINLMEVLGEKAKEEEITEGMEVHEQEEAEEEEKEYDEHIWLSLKNAQILVETIADTLVQADPKGADSYKNNKKEYMKKLEKIDELYAGAAKDAKKKVLLFADRFPFRYLVDDYSVSYYAAFAGCSADTEASFETVAFLAEKTDEEQLDSVIVLEGADKKIAQSVINNTKNKNQKILTMDSMQSVSKSDIESGVTYLSIMEKNLEVFRTALQ